jgi:hypothetical protein
VGQLGRNAYGRVLEPGRVLDCYLGLLVDRADDGRGAVVLVVAPAALLHPGVPRRPDGGAAGLAHRHLGQGWRRPQTAADAVIAAWHRGHLRGWGCGWTD